MLSPKIQDALNSQLNAEFFSSYLYLSMAAHFERSSLPGMATWMRFQAQEELGHALKFLNFINDRNGCVLLAEIEGPRTEWSSSLEAFEEAYAHEQKISGLINDLANLAREERDHATETFLQWFITEQVEEEASVSTVVDQLKLVGDNGVALFMVDGQLGQRVAPTMGAQP
ncbi:MAG: ferritin [Thermoguttaceae bacterium]